jgi:peptidyl-prolyl cis-trans isomerase D
MFGGVSGGDRVAVVGDERIDASELTAAAGNALEQMRAAEPDDDDAGFVAQGRPRPGARPDAPAHRHRRVRAQLGECAPASAWSTASCATCLRSAAPTAASTQKPLRAALSQRGLSEALVREDLEAGLLARQLITPIAFSPMMPESFGQRYASLLRERREGAVALLPSTPSRPPARRPTPSCRRSIARTAAASSARNAA